MLFACRTASERLVRDTYDLVAFVHNAAAHRDAVCAATTHGTVPYDRIVGKSPREVVW